ncbi:MAG TPA: BMP family ABC transporter substrate-binding protein [Spirochaetota bacterium]|nr:BMP family ABC transporter substrate-binding protein [Spirochaetota bacterium]HOL55980.1 BMP family ABC transporter substrate-binding protein [Spirochaetota bacterium]HPP03422.1 BMP family ABC transporter substrate-binding protein [Spirochaetota bacterium]
MKNFKILFSLIFLLFFVFSCKKEKLNNNLKDSNVLKIGLALGVGGLGDQSFNDMQYNGLIELSKKYNIEIVYKVPISSSPEDIDNVLDDLCKNEKCNFVIAGGGYLMVKSLDKVSNIYKEVKFVLIDDYAILKENVSSIVFAQNEGSFVVGVLAAKFSKTKKVGFIGGVDMLVVKSFYKGFEEGIRYVDKNVKLLVEYISLEKDNDYSGFDNPQKGYNIAQKMYDSGVDIIYSVAGASGNGIIQCANDNKKYVIGVDSNQDYMAKGYVLTSMMKRLDNAVFDIGEKFINNQFEGNKIYIYDYKNKGISLTDMEYTKEIIGEDIINYLKKIEEKIINGEIKVTNLM